MSEPIALTGPAASLRAFIQKYWPEQESEGNRLYTSQIVIREIAVALTDFAKVLNQFAASTLAEDSQSMDAVVHLLNTFSVSIFVAVRRALEDSGVIFPVIYEGGEK